MELYVQGKNCICKPVNLTLIFRKDFRHSENQKVLHRLVREVKGLQPDFLIQHIHGEL